MKRIARQISFLTGHPLTRDKPLAAIGRFLNWQIKSRIWENNKFQWIEGSKLLVRSGMTGATGNIYCGLHEFADMGFLWHFLQPGDLFGDIGANIGSYAILASAVCGANVIAVEPDPETSEHLRANVALNGCDSKVRIAETAVGDREGTIRFTVGLDTVNKVSVAGDNTASRVVPLTTLDTLFAQETPVMLKLDVEGFETAVLTGARRLLPNATLLVVQSESREPAVLDLLQRQGFEEVHYNPFTRALTDQPTVEHSNGLFIKNHQEVKRRLAAARRIQVLNHVL